MPIRSSALAKFNSGSGGTFTLFTVPAGQTYIVKEVRLLNWNAAGETFSVYAFDPASGSIGSIYDGTLAAYAHDSVTCWTVLGPGDQLQFVAAVSNQRVWVSGTKLPGFA